MTVHRLKLFRYRVTSVWGIMQDRLEVGTVVVDEERHDQDGEADWQVWSADAGEIAGGWNGVVIGPYEGDDPRPDQATATAAEGSTPSPAQES